MQKQHTTTARSTKDFTGKTIWITGASSGIGEALVRRLARDSCKLALTARDEDALARLKQSLRDTSAELHIYAGDVTDVARMRQIADDIAATLGSLDMLIANAGTHIPTNVLRFSSEEYMRLMQINFQGALHCIEAVLPQMRRQGSGTLVGVSSVAGYRGLPKAAAYGASKAALSHFLESIRFDLEAEGIAVRIVSPGFVKTPLTDKNSFHMPCLIGPEDAAEAIYRGLLRGSLEIHFPKRFTYFLKMLRILPYPLYHAVIKRVVVR